MRVIIRNGEAAVELDHDGSFTPTVMRELCDQAIKTYDRAFDDADEDVEPEQG